MKVELDDLITQTESAAIRGVTPQAISSLAKRGKLKTMRIGSESFYHARKLKLTSRL